MPERWIVATSGGWRRGTRVPYEPGPLLHHAVERSGCHGRAPKICHVGTALGDQLSMKAQVSDAAQVAGFSMSHLDLFPMPNVDDVEAHLLDQDVIWVGGGSVANLLAVWQLHGVDEIMRRVWEAGVVVSGVSAGSLCWHVGGTTDSFGPSLLPVTNGLGLVPFSNSVHYDSEAQRRPLFHALVAQGTLPAGYATDDGVGLVYRGTDFVEAVTEVDGKAAYYVEKDGDEIREHRLETRVLDGAITR